MVKDFSECNPDTRQRDRRRNMAAGSLTTEESTNRPTGHLVPNCSANGENNYEDRTPFPNASEHHISDAEEKNFPLSGKPYFTCIMSKSQVQHPYQMVIPKSFWPRLPSTCAPSTLCLQEKTWEMTYIGDQAMRRFNSRWKQFVIDNNLKMGDGCIFELMDEKKLKFQVQILRGDIPPEFADSGLRSDRPILID